MLWRQWAIITAVAALLVLMVTAAPALAGRFIGQTSQGRPAVVHTGAGGKVRRVKMVYRATCESGQSVPGRTIFVPPLRRSTPDAFFDAGRSKSEFEPGVIAISHSRISGHLTAANGWAGRYRDRFVIKADGQLLDRCKTGRLRWSAQPG
jgi:hypothetical protein